MPIQLPYKDPTAVDSILQGYCWLAEMNMNFATKHGRLVYLVHRDESAAYASAQPVASIALDIGPEGRPAQLTLITPEVPYQPAQFEPITGELVHDEIPYSPPVYGEPTLVPAFPSFDELIAQNGEVYMALRDAVYQFALTQPQFAGGTLI